ncbi:MAG TPA: hypothetical protein VGH28_08430 [Polyangiaceae bacterium]
MWAAYAGFLVLAINPFGGLVFAIPYAKAVLGVSPWIGALVGWPLAYVQVIAVDALFETLKRIPWWQRLIERKRTPRLERMTSSPYMFWLIVLFGSFVGPWLVMAVMRYANVPHKRIAVPMALSLGWNAAGIALLSVYAPRLLPR